MRGPAYMPHSNTHSITNIQVSTYLPHTQVLSQTITYLLTLTYVSHSYVMLLLILTLYNVSHFKHIVPSATMST